jgi:hypothetical protein
MGDGSMEWSEIFDPALGEWTKLPRVPPDCREADAGWVLSDGRFAVRGRGGDVGSSTRCAYVLNHAHTVWTELWVNKSRKGGPTCTPMAGGALMAGGISSDASGGSLKTAEIWDEESDKYFNIHSEMHHARGFTFAATQLPVAD